MFFGITFTSEAAVDVDAARGRVARVESLRALVHVCNMTKEMSE